MFSIMATFEPTRKMHRPRFTCDRKPLATFHSFRNTKNHLCSDPGRISTQKGSSRPTYVAIISQNYIAKQIRYLSSHTDSKSPRPSSTEIKRQLDVNPQENNFQREISPFPGVEPPDRVPHEFPAMPIAILDPTLRITPISNKKFIHFQTTSFPNLPIPNFAFPLPLRFPKQFMRRIHRIAPVNTIASSNHPTHHVLPLSCRFLIMLRLYPAASASCSATILTRPRPSASHPSPILSLYTTDLPSTILLHAPALSSRSIPQPPTYPGWIVDGSTLNPL